MDYIVESHKTLLFVFCFHRLLEKYFIHLVSNMVRGKLLQSRDSRKPFIKMLHAPYSV